MRTINKLGLKTDLILEEDEEDIKEKNNNDDFNKININTINSSFNLYEDVDNNSNDNSDNNSPSNTSNIIPDYIFDGLHLNDLKTNQNEKENNEKTLKIQWEDFSLYDGIIDYYSSNVWGTENCMKI